MPLTTLKSFIKSSQGGNIMTIVKNPFGLSVFYFQLLECKLQILQTSTDPCRQFAAPFKAAYF